MNADAVLWAARWTFILIVSIGTVGGIGVLALVLWREFKPRKGMATRLPRPRPDPRDWQGEFRRMNRP